MLQPFQHYSHFYCPQLTLYFFLTLALASCWRRTSDASPLTTHPSAHTLAWGRPCLHCCPFQIPRSTAVCLFFASLDLENYFVRAPTPAPGKEAAILLRGVRLHLPVDSMPVSPNYFWQEHPICGCLWQVGRRHVECVERELTNYLMVGWF